VATVVTAIIVPSVSFVYNPFWPTLNHWWPLFGVLWLAVGVSLHLLANATLGRLRQ
jgi:hypothetical protein